MSLDEQISELELMTLNVVRQIPQISYQELEEFVDGRQGLVDGIGDLLSNNSLSDSQKKRIDHILQYDSLILNQMSLLKNQSEEWLMQRGQAKAQRHAYELSYTQDSILMDQKK
ncbi:hypothetical protein [Paenibacillus pabuli]|uniref:hypothetical protein n=1 Tax=Paenibacillus pabuli TaxID=1472 RepID=UPI001FFF6F05|nr:hypothetical protein [Paenibacillus pabuli]UPK43466.1 hypothetical protein KET34_31120 [Paenibacillus pabuli]